MTMVMLSREGNTEPSMNYKEDKMVQDKDDCHSCLHLQFLLNSADRRTRIQCQKNNTLEKLSFSLLYYVTVKLEELHICRIPLSYQIMIVYKLSYGEIIKEKKIEQVIQTDLVILKNRKYLGNKSKYISEKQSCWKGHQKIVIFQGVLRRF